MANRIRLSGPMEFERWDSTMVPKEIQDEVFDGKDMDGLLILASTPNSFQKGALEAIKRRNETAHEKAIKMADLKAIQEEQERCRADHELELATTSYQKIWAKLQSVGHHCYKRGLLSEEELDKEEDVATFLESFAIYELDHDALMEELRDSKAEFDDAKKGVGDRFRVLKSLLGAYLSFSSASDGFHSSVQELKSARLDGIPVGVPAQPRIPSESFLITQPEVASGSIEERTKELRRLTVAIKKESMRVGQVLFLQYDTARRMGRTLPGSGMK